MVFAMKFKPVRNLASKRKYATPNTLESEITKYKMQNCCHEKVIIKPKNHLKMTGTPVRIRKHKKPRQNPLNGKANPENKIFKKNLESANFRFGSTWHFTPCLNENGMVFFQSKFYILFCLLIVADLRTLIMPPKRWKGS